MTSIIIADEKRLRLEGMCALLSNMNEFTLSGAYRNFKRLPSIIAQKVPDVLIINRDFPDPQFMEFLKIVTSTFSELRVLLVTSFANKFFLKEMGGLGVAGYIVSAASKDHLVAAVISCAKGETYFCDQVSDKLLNSHSNPFRVVYDLRTREIEVLRLLALEYSSKEIGEKLFISKNTVESHRKSLLRKLNVKTSIGLVKIALREGLVS